MRILEFEQLAEEFIEDSTLNNLSENTLASYQSDIDDFLKFQFDSKSNEITTKRIKSYFVSLRKRDLAAASMKRKSSTLRRILGDVFPKHIDIKLDKHLPEVLDEKEIIQIQKSIKNDREYLIINLLLVTGMRISELCALNASDVSKKFKICGKGSKERMIYLTSEILYKKLAKVFKQKNKPLIQNRNGGRLSVVYVRRIVKDVVRRAGIDKNITPHSLRHTYATRFIELGGGINKLKNLLGHSSLHTTDKYVHLADKQIEQEVTEKMNWDKVIKK